jgi:hypothetical protein
LQIADDLALQQATQNDSLYNQTWYMLYNLRRFI